MIKLIASDIDGTLLDKNKNLPHNFWDVEKILCENNIQFAAASGRQYYNLLELFKPIKNRCIFIAENGAIVMFRGKCLTLTTISKNDVDKIIDMARTIDNIDIILCGVQSAYYERDSKELLDYASNYYQKITYTKDLKQVEDDFLKVAVCDYANPKMNSYARFSVMENDLKIVISGRRWIDIMNKKTNKGEAIKHIQEKMKIGFEETMVFGDFLNDLEMMKTGAHSYAMQNAEPEIKAASKYITEYSNNESGVLKTIEDVVFGTL